MPWKSCWSVWDFAIAYRQYPRLQQTDPVVDGWTQCKLGPIWQNGKIHGSRVWRESCKHWVLWPSYILSIMLLRLALKVGRLLTFSLHCTHCLMMYLPGEKTLQWQQVIVWILYPSVTIGGLKCKCSNNYDGKSYKIYTCSFRKKCNNPGTKSFDTIKQWIKDPLAVTQLSFFIFSASPLEGFLCFYQTGLPLISFLGNNLEQLMRNPMKRVIKYDAMISVTNVLKLLKIDLSNKDHHRDSKSIDIGFVAGEQLKLVGRSVTERDIPEFRMQCNYFILTLITKIKAKSPLNYSLVRNLQCLDPKVIAMKPEDAI